MIPIPDISQVYPKTDMTLDSRFIIGEGNVRDLSNDANTGALHTGRAVSFDGATDYIDCGAGVDPTASGSSLVAWVKAGTVGSGGLSSILESCSGGNSRFAIGLSESESKFYVTRFWGSGYDGHTSTTVSAGTWYHVVGTVSADGNTIALYVNGVSMTESYGSNKSASGSSETAIGRWEDGTAYYFHGSIAGCKVFNTPLTAAQALELYNNPEQILPTGVAAANLRRYYPLCDYSNSGDDSLNGLYVMDLGADKVNGECYMTDTTVSGGGADLGESPSCPQLGLMQSTTRCLWNDTNTVCRISPTDTSLDCDGAFTYIFWFNTFSANPDAALYNPSAGSSSAANKGPTIFLDNASGGQMVIRTAITFGGTAYAWNTSSAVTVNGEWMHLAVTFPGGTSGDVIYYLNGSAIGVTNPSSRSGTQGTDDGVKDIGGSGSGVVWDGIISEFAMYKGTVLDADAVAQAYNSGVQGFDLSVDSGNYDNSSDLTYWVRINNPRVNRPLVGNSSFTAAFANTPATVTVPEGTTAGTTVFGNVENKLLDSGVINLNNGEYVQIPFDANLQPDVDAGPTGRKGWSVSVWSKMRNQGVSSPAAPSIFSCGKSNDRWYLRIRNDQSAMVQYNFGTGSGNTDVDEANNRVLDSNWHHHVIVLESDGTNWTVGKIWFDGARVQSGGSDFSEDISARGSNDCSNTDVLLIGAAGTVGDGNIAGDWDGAIAYPKIYARALVEDEIKLLYSSGYRVVGGL